MSPRDALGARDDGRCYAWQGAGAKAGHGRCRALAASVGMDPVDTSILVLVAALSFGLAYLGASVGLVLGQLRLPVLVYWLGSATVGAATSLAISAVSALVGAVRHGREGRVSLRLIFTIGAPSAAAAFMTAEFASGLDPLLIHGAIGIALLVTAWLMLRRPRPTPPPPVGAVAKPSSSTAQGEVEPVESESGSYSGLFGATDYDPPKRRVPAEVAVGGVLGAVAGVVGLLMGTLRLPLMIRLGASPARAVGTNLAIGCVTGLFAGAAMVMADRIDWRAFSAVTPATMLGAYLGASATGRMKKETLRRLIAWTLLGVGAWMATEPLWR